jgi:hypothetical protein
VAQRLVEPRLRDEAVPVGDSAGIKFFNRDARFLPQAAEINANLSQANVEI